MFTLEYLTTFHERVTLIVGFKVDSSNIQILFLILGTDDTALICFFFVHKYDALDLVIRF